MLKTQRGGWCTSRLVRAEAVVANGIHVFTLKVNYNGILCRT